MLKLLITRAYLIIYSFSIKLLAQVKNLVFQNSSNIVYANSNMINNYKN